MNSLTNLLDRIPVDTLVRLLGVGVPLIAVLVLGNVALSFIERAAVRHSRKRGLELRARYSVSVLRYLLATVAIIVAAFSFAGSWTGLGVSLGVIAAAAGFALQRPAASVAVAENVFEPSGKDQAGPSIGSHVVATTPDCVSAAWQSIATTSSTV